MVSFTKGGAIIGKYVYVKDDKNAPYEPGRWKEKKKLEVITTFLATGNLTETSKICNVPRETIKSWRQASWWDETVNDIRNGDAQRNDNKMSKIIDKALDMVIERIDDGDFQFDQKTGRLVKVPLRVRDLQTIATTIFDKRQLIRKQPTTIAADGIGQAERLLKLAQQFAEFSGKKTEEKLVEHYIDNDNVISMDDGSYQLIEGETNGEEVQGQGT